MLNLVWSTPGTSEDTTWDCSRAIYRPGVSAVYPDTVLGVSARDNLPSGSVANEIQVHSIPLGPFSSDAVAFRVVIGRRGSDPADTNTDVAHLTAVSVIYN